MTIRTEHLAREHENLGRLLLVLESHASGEEPESSLALMQRVVDYVVDWLELQHDPVEHLVLARLERRLPWLHALVEAHARDLREVRRNLASLSGLLARAQIDPRFDREELAQSAHTLAAALRRHVLVEDAELLPAADQALDREDWGFIEAALRTPGVRETSLEHERVASELSALAAELACSCESA